MIKIPCDICGKVLEFKEDLTEEIKDALGGFAICKKCQAGDLSANQSMHTTDPIQCLCEIPWFFNNRCIHCGGVFEIRPEDTTPCITTYRFKG